MVTELLTNSIRAGAERIDLQLCRNVADVEVRVIDNGHGWPVPRQPGHLETSGRGLQIVAALTERWGATSEAGRTVVWAQIAVPGH